MATSYGTSRLAGDESGPGSTSTIGCCGYTNPDDFSWRAVITGSLVGSIITASNLYFGLKVRRQPCTGDPARPTMRCPCTMKLN